MIDGEFFVFTQRGFKGCVLFGPYFNVDPGEYTVEFGLLDADPDNDWHQKAAAVLDVATDTGSQVLALRHVRTDELKANILILFQLKFQIADRRNLEFRVHTTGVRDLAIRLRRRLIHSNGTTDFPPSSEPALGKSGGGNREKHTTGAGHRPYFSRYAALDQAIIEADGTVPMSWATRNHETGAANFGDALSPVVVGALSGLNCHIKRVDDPKVRLLTSGTGLQSQQSGYVHVWGSGLNPKYDCYGRPQGYKKPLGLRLRPHAVRGALTRKTLLAEGVECPAIFGDPGWLLPQIIPPATKTYELGIIPHIFMLEEQSPASRVLETFRCFDVGSEKKVKIITTLHAPSWEGFVERVREITSCRRIISTSFHGLIVPQAYGIPAMFLHHNSSDCLIKGDLCDDDSEIDIRVRDFMLGAGHTSLPLYARRHEDRTDWDDVIKAIDAAWEPLAVDIGPFVEAFPLTLGPREDRWKIPDELAAQFIF
jgi:hypothetical protein